MQPKTSSSAGWLLVILANLLIHLATALPPRASGLRAYRDESDDGGPIRDESVRHLDPIDGVHHFESEQELNAFLRQMEDRMKGTNGKWKVEYRKYSSHSDGAAGGGADGDVQTQLVDGSSSLLNGASMINCKRCTLKVRRVGNGELVGGGGESSSYTAGSTKTSSSRHSSSYGSGASMTADDVLRNYGDVENVAEAGQVNRNVKVTKVVKTSTSGSRAYGSDGSMTVGDLLRDYGNTGERGTGNVKVTKTVTTSTNAETGEDFDADAALARADDILRRYQAGEDLNLPAGSRNVKVTKVVTTSGSGGSGYSGQGRVSQDVADQISGLGNTGSYGTGSSNVYGSESYGNAGGYGNSDSYSSGSRNVKVTKVTTTKTTGGSSTGSFGTGRYSTSASEGDVETLGNTGYSSGMGGSRDMKVTRVTTTSGDGGSSGLYSGSYGSGGSGVTTQEGYGGISDTASTGGQYNRKVKVTKVVTSSGSTGSYGSRETDDLLQGGSAGNVRVTDSYGGSSGYSSQSHARNQGSGQVYTSSNYGSSGNIGSTGAGETMGFTDRDIDHSAGQTMRKSVKITKSYWKGDTRLGSFDGTEGNLDEELRRLLEQHRIDGDYQNGKTVTTVTTTTSVNGGTPVVKTERYVKDGYDTSLDMKSLGTLDTSADSVYGQSHYSTSSLGDIDHSAGQTMRKSVKITKSYWKGDTQLGSFDGSGGNLDEELRRLLEQHRIDGDYQNGKTVTTVTTTTSANGGTPVVKTERYVKDGYDTSLDMKSLGTLDTSADSVYGQSHYSTSSLGDIDHSAGQTMRKSVKITKSYWKGDTQLGSFDGSGGNLDEELRRLLEQHRIDGDYQNGKTVTTVTTTTSANGGTPVVKTERYVKDGYDTSLDMKSLGTLDTAADSIYGQSHHSTSSLGDIDHSAGQTMRKSVKITKSYWKGDTRLGSFDGTEGNLDGELRRLLEQHRIDGDYQNGKTVTTVTTTTSVNGGTPVVKTERYVKDGYDTSLDMKSLGTLDTAADSIYGKSHYSTSTLGNTGSTGSLDHLGGTTKTSRKNVKISKTYWKGNTQVGSHSGSDQIDEELKRRLEGFKNDGDYINGKTVTTVTTTTSTNGGAPVVKTERFVKDGFDTSINMNSFGTLDTSYHGSSDTSYNSAHGESQILSSHGAGNSLGNTDGNTYESSRKTTKITKTYWKGSTQLGSIGDADHGDDDLRRRLEELIRNGEVQDGKTVTTVTTTTSTNGGTPIVKTERFVKNGIDTSLHRDSFGTLDTSYGSTSDQSYSMTSSHGSDSQTAIQGTGIGRTPVRPGSSGYSSGRVVSGGTYGSSVHQGSTIAEQMNGKGFRTVVVGGEIQPDRDERPLVIEATPAPAGPARHARPEGSMSSHGGSSYGSSLVESTYTGGVSGGSPRPARPISSRPESSSSGYTKTIVSTHKTSEHSGSMNTYSSGSIDSIGHDVRTPQTGGSRVITADTGNSHGSVQQTVGQDSSSYILSASGSSEGSYGHRRVPSGEPVHSSSGVVDSSYHARPDGVPVVSGSYFNSGRKTTDSVSESSGLPALSQNGVSQTSGHKVASSSTYTKHAESTSTGGYGAGSNTHWSSHSSNDNSGGSSSSEEDEAYHGPAPTPSPSIKIGYGTGVGGYGGGSRTVVSGSYSQHTGSSYGGPVAYPAETSGYNTGVKLAPSSGYSSGGSYKSNSYSSGTGSYGSGSSYGSSGTGSYGSSGTGSYGSSHGSSMGSYGSNTDGSRKVTSYGTGDCVEGSPVCGQASGDQATGYSRRSPSYSYSQSWSSGSGYGRSSASGVKGSARPERISQEGNTDCDDAN